MLNILQIAVLTDNYIYIIHDPDSNQTAVVDPAVAEPVLDLLKAKGWQLTYILNTHHHHDHTDANLALKQQTGCKIIAAQADRHRIPGVDVGVEDGDLISIGKHAAQVISTPGHTNAHVVYYFAEQALLFCGDTLFSLGCGRLFEGTPAQMWQSLQKLKSLPGSTRIYCAHEYTLSNGQFAFSLEPHNPALQARMIWVTEQRRQQLPTIPSTIADEIACNPFLREDSLEIQKNINKIGKPPVEVFTEIRRLKDHF
jgi:hydroxyacylglutathione hydrolase